MLRGFGPRFMIEAMNPRSKVVRTLQGSQLPHDEERIYARNLEVPSGGAVGTARAIARAYGAFVVGGGELGLTSATLELLAAPPVPPARGFQDVCLKGDVRFSLGFMKPGGAWQFGGARSFGSPGSGGSLGFADPVTGRLTFEGQAIVGAIHSTMIQLIAAGRTDEVPKLCDPFVDWVARHLTCTPGPRPTGRVKVDLDLGVDSPAPA